MKLKLKCPYLLYNGRGISNPQMKYYLENMDRDDCIAENCKDFEKCWGEKNPKEDLIEEVFEETKNG